MASSIDASTSGAGGVITTADNSGVLQLKSGGTTIATVSSTGLQQNVGAPAFSAYAGSATSLSNNAYTKVLFDTEEFDTNNNFASSRFTPTVAGYYQLNAVINFASYLTTETVLAIYKNGTAFKYLNDFITSRLYAINGNVIVSANGTTDYFEIYVYQNNGSAINTASGATNTFFQASMVRSA